MNTETISQQLSQSLSMFLLLAVELTALFLIISYLVGVLQQYITPDKIRTTLSSKNGRGYFISAILGSITPFCSCSTIPFLQGLLRARAGFGPTMVFLFASPLLNPIIIGLFAITFGWKVTLFYFVVALGVSVIAGYVLEKLGFERHIKPLDQVASDCASDCDSEPMPTPAPAPAQNDCGCSEPSLSELNFKPVEAGTQASCCESEPKKTSKPTNKWTAPWQQTVKDFKAVLPYLLLGIGIGSLIYGFVPTEFIAKHTSEENLLAVPVSAVIGVPLYVRAEAVIPLSAALVAKGMSLGAAMALIIGSAGASLTEVILLKSLFKNQIIIAFLVTVLGMAILSGYTLNALL